MLVAGCRHEIEVVIDRTPIIFPDYQNVTIPYNIAPLNFRVNEKGEKIIVNVRGREKNSDFVFRGDKVIFPDKKWTRLLNENKDGFIEIYISILKNDSIRKYKPYKIFIAGDLIDGYLVYRLLMPGFQNWNQMGIYQRSLSSFRQETIMDSRLLPGTCMNCHSFAMNDPENMVFHLREFYPGTILFQGNKIEKLNTKAGKMFGNAAFPYWHPSKKYIAFSVNRVNQIFHAIGTFRAAAIDMKSDIFVYDIENNKMLSSPVLSAAGKFETFPCFSPDGLKLYYCSADSVKMPQKFDKTRYSLCSVSFNPLTGEFGEKADTLISGPAINKSISIPRVSPDGRFLIFCMADYGAFPSYNPEANLYLLDLNSRKYKPLEILNSNSVESWHSWSSTGRWIVFSSRRGNGLYSDVYIAFMDENGNAGKPFLLPQKDPNFYDTFLFSYNVPELVKSKVLIDPYQVEKIARKTPAVQVMSESGH
jgi:hypothetical protein